MKLSIFVKPKSKQQRVEKTEAGYVVYVTEPPVDDRANQAVIELLARHFGVPRSEVVIVAGARSKRKVVEIKH